MRRSTISKGERKHVAHTATEEKVATGLRLKIRQLDKKLLMNHGRISSGEEDKKGGARGERRKGEEDEGPIRKQSWLSINRPVL